MDSPTLGGVVVNNAHNLFLVDAVVLASVVAFWDRLQWYSRTRIRPHSELLKSLVVSVPASCIGENSSYINRALFLCGSK